MVKIPTSERLTSFAPSTQPTMNVSINTSALAAPGKGLESMGHALGSLGDAFQSQINEEDEFRDKLKLLQFQNQQDAANIDARRNYDREDPNGYALERTGQLSQSIDQFIPTLRTPKQQKLAKLHLENYRGNVYEKDLGFEYDRRDEKIYDEARGAIVGQFAHPSLDDPETFDKQIETTMKGIDALVSSYPIKDGRQRALINEAAGLALKRLEEVYTKADRAEELPTAARKLIEKLAPQQGMPGTGGIGPQSSLQPGSAMSVAKQFLGKHEGTDTAALASFFKKSGGQNLNPADTAWCAAFVNAALGATGQKGTGTLLARDFLKIGTATKEPSEGDIVVLSRGDPSGWQGHVGFYAGKDANGNIMVLGGNQGNKVSIASYSADRVLGFRKPPKAGSEVGGLNLASGAESASGANVTSLATAYSPKAGGDKMEGGYASSKPGPDGKAEVRTLADVQAGRSEYVTLAGDASQYGKTYTIPEITFRDAAGKEHTLKNVKGVVHDTGSAFKGKGEGRIDIPADRDLPDGGASQPYSKQKIQLVPAGQGESKMALGGPLPDKQRVALAGLSPEDKAKKLEGLVTQGYGSVVHQLDKDGNDVLVVRKSDRPEWWRNGRSGNPEVKSEIDNPDFAGPEWANESIKKIRSGEVRPMNTIPGRTQVADASGRTGASPAYGGALAETLMKHMPGFEAKAKAAERKYLDQTMKMIEDANKVVLEGYDPKQEDLDEIEMRLEKKPQLANTYGLHPLMASIQTNVERVRMLRQLHPQQLADAISEIDRRLAVNGADKYMLAEKKRMETLLQAMRKGVDNDPLTWAERTRAQVPVTSVAATIKNETGAPLRKEPGQGVADTAAFTADSVAPAMPRAPIEIEPIRFDDPDVDAKLARRLEQAKSVGSYYNQPAQFFTQTERDQLKDIFRNGGAPMLGTLGRIYKAFGTDTPAAMREFAKDAPEAAMIGRLMAEGGDAKLLEDAAKGLHLRTAEGDKFISRVDKKLVDPDASAVLPVLAKTPGMIDPAMRMTSAVYEYRHRYMGKDKFDADLWMKTFKEVLGETTDKDGATYGGVGKQKNGWFDGAWSSNILVPAGVKQDKFDDLIGALSEDNLKTLGVPKHGNYQELNIKEVRAATFQSVGNGKYLLQTGTAPNGDPRYAMDGTGQKPYVLDLNKIMPDLKKRKPELFRP